MRVTAAVEKEAGFSRTRIWLRLLGGVACVGASGLLFLTELTEAYALAAWPLLISGILFSIVAVVDATKARQERRAVSARRARSFAATRGGSHTLGR